MQIYFMYFEEFLSNRDLNYHHILYKKVEHERFTYFSNDKVDGNTLLSVNIMIWQNWKVKNLKVKNLKVEDQFTI